MKKRMNGLLTAITICAMVAIMMSAMPSENIMTKDNDTTVINTELLSKNVKGFKGTTPVKIFIVKNKIAKIVKIEALPNHETPKFFDKAKTLLSEFTGKSVSKATKMDVDGVSGATYSSKALKKNVALGLAYYNKNK